MKAITKMHKNGHTEIRSYLKRGTMQISGATKEARSSAKKAMKDVREYCQENPGKAIGIAAAAAAIASLLLVKALSEKRSTAEKAFSDLFRKGEAAWKYLKDGAKPAVQKIRKSLDAA